MSAHIIGADMSIAPDEKDEKILQTRAEAWDKRPAPRVGDYIVFSDGVIHRFSHDWDEYGLQTSKEYIMASNHDRPARLRFSDGMEFDLSGDLRVVHRRDGWYVVGRGMLIPVADREAGDRTVALMKDEGGSDDAIRT